MAAFLLPSCLPSSGRPALSVSRGVSARGRSASVLMASSVEDLDGDADIESKMGKEEVARVRSQELNVSIEEYPEWIREFLVPPIALKKRTDLKKIMVIGAGPIIIGQACEFDYSGTQACKALRDEGYSVVLVNSNPATIMTDNDTADRIYIEPLTIEVLEKVMRGDSSSKKQLRLAGKGTR